MTLYLFNSFILCLILTTNVNSWKGYHTEIDDELPAISWKECGIGVRKCDPNTGFEDPFVSSRVWGGQFASTGEYPWFASLNINSDGCGGAIINEWWIVTAAHCMLRGRTTTENRTVIVRIGSINKYMSRHLFAERVVFHSIYVKTVASDLEIYKRMRALKHRIRLNYVSEGNKTLLSKLIDEYLVVLNEFNTKVRGANVSELQWDIALLKMKNRIVPLFNETHYKINSICLPKSGITNTKNESAVMLGIGLTDPHIYSLGNLKKGITIILDTNTCADYTISVTHRYNVKDNICFKRLNTRNESLLNSSICSGDSGSPLHQYYECKAVQMGIASSIEEVDGSCGQRGRLVRVSIHMPWIRSIILSNDIIIICETNGLLIVSVITTAIIALIFCFILLLLTILILKRRPQQL